MHSASRTTAIAVSVALLVPSAALAQAAISGISPSAAPTSASDSTGPIILTIIGTSFGSAGEVAVGGRLCGVRAYSDAQVQCNLPPGEGAQLSVVIFKGGAQVARADGIFSYDPPAIAGISPASAPTAGGDIITIIGSSFGLAPVPLVGGSLCAPRLTAHDRIECTVPPGEGKNLDVRVLAANQVGSAPSFSYDAPSISAIQPASLPTAGGALLTLIGQSFGLNPRVQVGALECSVQTKNHDRVVCLSPEGEGFDTPAALRVAGQVASFSVRFDPPSIVSVTPASAPTSGGTLLTIIGSSFGVTPAVSVGGRPCPGILTQHDRTVCSAPEGEGAALDVALTVGGQATSLPGVFSYDLPSIDGITSASAPTTGGSILTIIGRSFGLAPSVQVGASACPLASATHERIECTLPAGEGARVPLSVTSPAGTSTTQASFDYDPPLIASISPASGPRSGGVLLTISGLSFGQNPSATVGGADCPTLSSAHTQMICTLPAGSGLAPVVVQASGQKSAPAVFQYDPLVCPAGTFASGDACTPCPLGTYQDDAGATSCEPCPRGTHGDAQGLTACTPCVAGTYQGALGQTACEPCEPGTFQPQSGQTQCTSCPAGRATAVSGAQTCDPCAVGTFAPTSGLSTCEPCPPGSFADASSSSSCSPCPPGSISDVPGSTSCAPCPLGTAQAQAGRATCPFCPAGTFAAAAGSEVCTPCDYGTYQDLAGRSACTACPDCPGCGDAACMPRTGECPSPCPACGDGTTNAGEWCDDGNVVDGDGCTECAIDPGYTCIEAPPAPSSCVVTVPCGDGVKDDAEACDDGNLRAADGCDAACGLEDGWDCTLDATGAIDRCLPVHGDGRVVGDERCDDGNTTRGDGCSDGTVDEDWACTGEAPSRCTSLTSCGDGTVDTGEECDDGGLSDRDGCSSTCAFEAGWECEGGACVPIEADGLRVGDEECDDGNDAGGDGCDGGVIETGWACDASSPSRCTPLSSCGDQVLDAGEECDDGNRDEGDGCDRFCQEESEDEPSTGGCAQTPAGFAALALVGLVAMLRRRR